MAIYILTEEDGRVSELLTAPDDYRAPEGFIRMDDFPITDTPWDWRIVDGEAVYDPAPIDEEIEAALQKQAAMMGCLPVFAQALANTVEIPDETALEVIPLFPDWVSGKEYAIGFKVQYEGVLYRCLQAHASQETWTPDVSASLWARVLIPDPETIPEWVQPDSTNPYMTGDRVTHNGLTWQSDIDNNVWEPGVYGWTQISQEGDA